MSNTADPAERFHLVLTPFGVRRPVSRAAYIGAGGALLLLKYGLENALLYGSLERWLAPAEFLSPFFVHRAMVLASVQASVAWAVIALHLPFLRIGLSMSARRAIDAGLKPWWSFLFILPRAQYSLIAALCVLPPKPRTTPRSMGPFRTGLSAAPERSLAPSHATLFRLLRATFVGSAVSLGMRALAIQWFPSHWGVLPIPVVGFVAGAVAARTRDPRATKRPSLLRILAWGLGVLASLPIFLLIVSGMEWALAFIVFAAVLVICVFQGLILSGWYVGAALGAAGVALDRRDLETGDGVDEAATARGDSK